VTTNKSDEKRHFHRIFYHADAILSHQERNYPCKIIDLSLKGCLLSLEQPWTESNNDSYTLTLKLSDEISIVMDLTMSHAEGQRVGFTCNHMDIDSISNLRRLVELNLGDSELLERDLTALSDLGNRD